MKIIVSNVIQITEPSKAILDYCKKELIIANPEYEKKRRMGIWLGQTKKTYKLFEENEETLFLPVGCFNDIWQIHPIKGDYSEYSVVSTIEPFTSTISLRTYQKPVIEAVKKYVNGVIVMFAGAGKTNTGLELVSELKQKTLWLTHTKDLLDQAKTRCEDNMSCSTSTITEGKMDTSGDIVFATVQTLANFIDKDMVAQDLFGLIIVDEVQHCAVSIESIGRFEKCVNYFPARYKVGLTATLHRADQLEGTVNKIIGDTIYELKKENDDFVGYYEDKEICRVPILDFQVPVEIQMLQSDYVIHDKDVYDKDGMTVSFTKLISDMSMDIDRNKMIYTQINKSVGSTLILSDRISQLEYLQNKIPNSVLITGKSKRKDREIALERVRQGEIKYLFASYSLAKEGLDLPIVSNLIMGTPVKDLTVVVQSLGRIQRPYRDKKVAYCYDIYDDVSMLYKFYTKRKAIYKKEGYKIEGVK